MPRTMMHVNNIFWLGGVPMFIKDVIAAYPEFYHVVGFLWENSGFAPHPDYDMAQEWQHTYGCRVGHIETLNYEAIAGVDPDVLMLHNTPYRYAAKRHGTFDWIQSWPSINFHHMRSDIIRGSAHHVCISQDVASRYTAKEREAMGDFVICPPAINATGFASVNRPPRDKLTIGKVSSDWNPKKYPQQLLDVLKGISAKHDVNVSVVGAAKHWPDPGLPNLAMPPALSKPMPDLLADLDIFLYINDPSLPESWCRAVTEAMASGLPIVAERRGGIVEQIEDGVDGFLCTTTEDFITALDKLITDKELRNQFGERAKIKAKTQFNLSRIRKELDPLVLKCLTSSVG